MSNRVYAIADTHFGHAKIAALRGYTSVEEHDRDLVSRWNSTVRKNDTVWHLGDVYFGGKDAHHIIAQLNGVKRLVLGNHDTYGIQIYQLYFDKIFGAAQMYGCILTHIPVADQQLQTRYRLNVHGHLHAWYLNDARYRCVSAEHVDLRPALLRDVIDGVLN